MSGRVDRAAGLTEGESGHRVEWVSDAGQRLKGGVEATGGPGVVSAGH